MSLPIISLKYCAHHTFYSKYSPTLDREIVLKIPFWWLNGHFVWSEIEFLHVWTCQSGEIGHCLTSQGSEKCRRKPRHSSWLEILRPDPRSCILFPFREFCLTYSSICRPDHWVKPLHMINCLVDATTLLYCVCSPVHINQILLTRPLGRNCFRA